MFKPGDRAVTKGIEVEIITAPHGAFCTECRGLICTCDLVGYIKSHQCRPKFVCTNCLVPRREERVRALIAAAKETIKYADNNNLFPVAELLKQALRDLGEE